MVLVNASGDLDETVQYSFDADASKVGSRLGANQCVVVSAGNLNSFYLWSGDDGDETREEGKVHCNGDCEGGFFKIEDTYWWLVMDNYELSPLGEDEERPDINTCTTL